VKLNDMQRQKDLEDLRIIVIRFTNKEIRNNIGQVLQIIEVTLNNHKLKFPL
jgi:very-short-patch-repair endonuclease